MTDTSNTRSDALAWVAGSDAPEKSALNLGFMALTDSASLIVAATQGFAQPYGLTLNLQRQASWAGLRDRLLSQQLVKLFLITGDGIKAVIHLGKRITYGFFVAVQRLITLRLRDIHLCIQRLSVQQRRKNTAAHAPELQRVIQQAG